MDIPLVNEGRRSFPSEHAAISSAALGYLGLMIASSNVFSRTKVGGIPSTDLEKGIKRIESQLSQTLWKLLFTISLVFGWVMASWLVWFKVIENRCKYPSCSLTDEEIIPRISWVVYSLELLVHI